jgi:hypothetical protein
VSAASAARTCSGRSVRTATYVAEGIDPDDAETWNVTAQDVPVLPDVLTRLEQQPGETARSLAERLRPFCTGTLAGLFGGRTTLRVGTRLTNFDLEGLGSELRPLAVWLAARHPRTRFWATSTCSSTPPSGSPGRGGAAGPRPSTGPPTAWPSRPPRSPAGQPSVFWRIRCFPCAAGRFQMKRKE